MGDKPTVGPVFDNLFKLLEHPTHGSAAGGPRSIVYEPRIPREPSWPAPDTLPLLFYLPGIDGTGLAAYRQFPSLSRAFDLRALFMPPAERQPFEQLVEHVAAQVEAEIARAAPTRPVYLLGESFGGIMALALAERLPKVDRVVLVNPATSFADSPWPVAGPLLTALPDQLYRLLPLALSPLLTNPFSIAQNAIRPGDAPARQLASMLQGMVDLLPELSSLRVVLPPETLAWRLKLLQEGSVAVNRLLNGVQQRVLLLAAEQDLVRARACMCTCGLLCMCCRCMLV